MSANRSKDRSSLCAFTFSDGRHCRTPRRPGHPYLCHYHARKESQALAGDRAGEDIARHLSGQYISACDLSSALGRLFAAVAQGHVKPKTATNLAYLGQTLAQTVALAQNEYINAFGAESWRKAVRSSFAQDQSPAKPPSLPAPTSAAKSAP
ncbi:MAG TPA: hypothetical protein VN025_20735 [Candidatus Dormibacteraeota bacterium]|jgi:hypothetical protein|nr:hypothetical protein [Candidatus Dormibacteraeota bacterium]